jgi:tetratricopeptide (TPR) repeat protein
MHVGRWPIVILALAAAGAGLLGCWNAGTKDSTGKVPITTASKKALKEYLRGRDLLEKLRVTDAREHYAEAVRLDPSFALAFVGLANTAPTAAEFFDALRRATALAGTVSEGEAHIIRALEAGANSRPEEQLKRLSALVDAYPDDERAHNLLGLYYYGRQEWDQSSAEFHRATEINPEFSAPYNQLGYALRFQGDLAGAEKAFTKYIELIPKEPNPYDSYAELLMQMGRFRESIAQYEKALAINPNFANSYIGIGNDYIFLGQPVQARNSFTKLGFIARNDGEERQAHFWTAISHLHDGDTATALDEVGKMYEIAKKGDDRLSMASDLRVMAEILLDAGRTDDAEARFTESVTMAQSAVVTADVKESVRRNSLFNIARVALLRKDLASATATAEHYREAAEERKIPFEVRQSHELLGLIALARKDFPTAVRELEQANDHNPRVLFDLSKAYAGTGKAEAARTTLERVANFNAFSLNYAFVRNRALAMLRDSRAPAQDRPNPRTAASAPPGREP